jgi:hypothetical protein
VPPRALTRPVDLSTPTERSETPTRRRGSGGLAVVSGLVLLLGLVLPSSYDDRLDEDLPFALVYLVPVTCLVVAAGLVLLLGRNVAGFLAGLAVTSPWGAAVLITSLAGGHVDADHPGGWTLLADLVLLLLAGWVALVSAHRAGAVRVAWRRPDRPTSVALVIAGIGAARLFGWGLYLPAELVFAVGVLPAVLLIAVPVWVMCLRRFALAVVIGWAAAGLVIGLSLVEAAFELEVTWLRPLGVFPALLAVIAATAVDRESSDQPVTG